MRFIIPTLFCLVLSLLARGDAPDWAQPPAWSAAPGYSVQVGYAQVSRVFDADATMVDIFDEAGVTGLPTNFHPLSPYGIQWNKTFRNDLSFLDDAEYRQRLVLLLTQFRLQSERRTRLAERRNPRNP